MHLARLAKHAEILGITIPEFDIPEGLDGLVKIQIDENGVEFHSKPFYQEIHMDAEGVTVPEGNERVPERVKLVTFAKSGNGVIDKSSGAEDSVFPILSLHSIVYEYEPFSRSIVTGVIRSPLLIF